MNEIKAIIQPFVLDQVMEGLRRIDGLPGITVSEVRGFGRTRGRTADETQLVAIALSHELVPITA